MRWLLILILAFSVAACADSGDDDDATTNESSATNTTEVEATEATGGEATEEEAGDDPTATEAVATVTTATAPSPTATEAPASPTTPPATATTPAASSDVQLGKWVNKEPSFGGSVYTMGEIVNQGQGEAANVQVVVTYYDAAGTVIGSAEAFDVMPRLDAGQKSPFRAIGLNVPLANVSETKIQVQFENFDPGDFMADFYYTDIDVTQVSWANDSIAGEVVNSGDASSKSVKVLVIGYDAAGEVFGVYPLYIGLDQLDAGMTSSFSATFLGLGDESPTTVEAVAFGLSS